MTDLLRIARSNQPVLITGETGTGKEVTARAIHNDSGRHEEPFVAINCAALPDALAESELFGHVRGAFTGAETARKGAFVEAARGTVFLDEIGDAPRTLQAKLLRALASNEVVPVGGGKPVSIRARLVCATNVDLAAAVKAGTFRADLLYRIDVLRVALVPLRERSDEEFEGIVRNLVVRVNDECGSALRVDGELIASLRAHAWPGNVREMKNALTRMAVESGDAEARLPVTRDPREWTRDDLARVVAKYGSQRRAAEALGVNYSRIQRQQARLDQQSEAEVRA